MFLSLYTYGLTGGIEKVCRTFTDVLQDLTEGNSLKKHFTLSLHDGKAKNRHYQSFGGRIGLFSLSTFKKSLSATTIILSHINLLPLARLIRIVSPKKQIILFAHGIEVWRPLARWQRDFLSKIEIWAVSNYTADRIKKEHSIDGQNIHVLNNSLPKDFALINEDQDLELTTSKYNIRKNSKVLLTVCRLSSAEQYKGYDLVLQSLKDLIRIYPELRYFIVGKADEAEQKRVENLIVGYKLEEHVTLTGYVSDAEIRQFYQLADIFVMPSKGEGFGLVFTEALVNGCRVLAGNADGSSDALLNGEMGLLVNPENAGEIYAGLIQLLNQPLNEIEVKARRDKVIENFGYDKYLAKAKALLTSAPAPEEKIGTGPLLKSGS